MQLAYFRILNLHTQAINQRHRYYNNYICYCRPIFGWSGLGSGRDCCLHSTAQSAPTRGVWGMPPPSPKEKFGFKQMDLRPPSEMVSGAF